MYTRQITAATILLFCSALSSNLLANGWYSEPIISANNCDSLDYKEVTTFLAKYYNPTLIYAANFDGTGVKMYQGYAIASALMIKSQACMSEALGLQELTANLKKEQAVLSSGTSFTTEEMEKHRKISSEAQKKIKAAAKKSAELTPQQKKTFGLGFGSYIASVYATKKLSESIEKFLKKATKKSSFGGWFKKAKTNPTSLAAEVKAKANAVLAAKAIAPGVYNLLESSMTNGQFLWSYTQKQDIEVSKDATSNLPW